MKHILMVDDMAVNLERAAELLKDAYEISAVKSGRQALVILRERIPDMIIIDINMPDMNGYELMEVVRSDVRLKDIPVVFISVETDRESEIEALKMGAMDFCKKRLIISKSLDLRAYKQDFKLKMLPIYYF